MSLWSQLCQLIITWLFYVFLFKNTLSDIYCWSISTELVANSTRMHAWMKLLSHVWFLCKAHYRLLVLRDARQSCSRTLGNHFKQWNHQHKAHKCENLALKRPQKGHLCVVWALKQDSRAPPCLSSAGNTCIGNSIFHHSACPRMTEKVLWALILDLQIGWS